MPAFTFDSKNTMLNALGVGQISLHQAYDAAGGQELVGGDPPYVRMVPTFSPAVGGVLVAVGVPYMFNVPEASQVGWVGLWNVDGTVFYGMTPNGGGAPVQVVLPNPGDAVLLAPGHTFTTGDMAIGWIAPDLGDGAAIWVVTVISAVAISLADPAGNPASFAQPFSGFMQRIIFQTFDAQGTFPVNSLAINANTGT